MKEHKNPKVLSEGILWMVAAVDDFGVSLLKLKVILAGLLYSIWSYCALSTNQFGCFRSKCICIGRI